MKCKPRLFLQYRDEKARAFVVRCKGWRCEHCRQRRLRKLRCIAIAGNPNTFITLTTNPHTGRDPADRAKTAVKAWRALVAKIKRAYHYDALEYLVVVEETKRGEPHLHIIARCKWIEQKWLSERWEELTGARIVDIRRVTNPRAAANYVSKYITKNPAAFPGVRRYNKSKRWLPKQEKPAAQAFWKAAPIRELNIDLAWQPFLMQQAGWSLVACGEDFTEWTAAPGTGPPPLWERAREVY